MTTLQTFFGPPAVKAIVGNDETVNGSTPIVPISATWRAGANLRQILAGTTVANTYKTALSVTGAGSLLFAALATNNATSRTIKMRITIDGVQVSERTGTAMASLGKAIVAVGAIDGAASAPGTVPITFGDVRFNKSLLIEVQSSLAETDLIYLLTNYVLT